MFILNNSFQMSFFLLLFLESMSFLEEFILIFLGTSSNTVLIARKLRDNFEDYLEIKCLFHVQICTFGVNCTNILCSNHYQTYPIKFIHISNVGYAYTLHANTLFIIECKNAFTKEIIPTLSNTLRNTRNIFLMFISDI